jgi:hypothetical protein
MVIALCMAALATIALRNGERLFQLLSSTS